MDEKTPLNQVFTNQPEKDRAERLSELSKVRMNLEREIQFHELRLQNLRKQHKTITGYIQWTEQTYPKFKK